MKTPLRVQAVSRHLRDTIKNSSALQRKSFLRPADSMRQMEKFDGGVKRFVGLIAKTECRKWYYDPVRLNPLLINTAKANTVFDWHATDTKPHLYPVPGRSSSAYHMALTQPPLEVYRTSDIGEGHHRYFRQSIKYSKPWRDSEQSRPVGCALPLGPARVRRVADLSCEEGRWDIPVMED